MKRELIAGAITLALAAAATADNQTSQTRTYTNSGKHIVITTKGGNDVAAAMNDSGIDIEDIADVEVFVVGDEDVAVPRISGPGMRRIVRRNRAEDSYTMDADTAECVLKHLAKVQDDAAARLLHAACRALNKES